MLGNVNLTAFSLPSAFPHLFQAVFCFVHLPNQLALVFHNFGVAAVAGVLTRAAV
jgi:hypothetical protein